jgi:AraC-like DNA-binding protein
MELASLFASERGALADSSSWPPTWRRLAFVERGRCRSLTREGVSFFDSPFVLATGSTLSTRLVAASGVALQFAPRVADELVYRLGGDDASLLSSAEPICIALKKAEAGAYGGLFDDVADAWRERQAGDLVLVRVTGLLVRLRRYGSATHRADRSSASMDVSSIEAYIKARFRESLSLEKMADELGYSPPYLSRYFKQKTGLCLFEYVNARRIAEACLLLKGTDKTVTEIAFEVGYNNLSFFNRYFRKLMDASPQEYRKRSMGGL